MKHLGVGAMIVAAVCALQTAGAEQPPIIDRALLFGEITISDAQISPDGRYISFLKPYRGTTNIWLKKTIEPFSAARPMSAQSVRPIATYFWSWDSKYLLFVQDAGGDENFNVYAIDPTEPADARTGVPSSRALTRFAGVRTEIYAAPKAKPDLLYIGLNDRDPKWHDLYELRISTGEKRLIRKNTQEIATWDFDNEGELRLAERTNNAGDTQVLRVDPTGLKLIYSCTVMESCTVSRFDASNHGVYLITNKGQLDLAELDRLDFLSGAVSKVESDPKNRADLADVTTSEVDYRILFTLYQDAVPRLYFKDKEFERDYRWLSSRLPGKQFTFGARSRDEAVWIVTAYSDTDPGATYIWNRSQKSLALQYLLRARLPRASLSQRGPFEFKSSDGLTIPGYLTLPKGLPAKGLPLLVWVHGGPWDADTYGYDSVAQFLANRGYAVLQPNFRGSTGYGKKFLNAGNGQWGRKMQDDLTWGVRALVAAGTVDPKRVGIGGASYGGYATLAGVAFTPDIYAAAVAYVAPSNLLTLLDAIPPYWEAVRTQMYARMADPRTPQGKALLVAESPLTRAKSIVTPLLVIQGKNDPRVNIRESNQIVAAVRDNSKPIEYLVAADEGHGFIRPINNLAVFTAMERFYARHLGGRYQSDVPRDVAAKLAELTVDPKTVSGSVALSGALAAPPASSQ